MRRSRNLVSGQQLRAGRILAGLTQSALAKLADLHPNSVRYVERQESVTTNHSSVSLERALLNSGVVCFSEPTPGVRVAEFSA